MFFHKAEGEEEENEKEPPKTSIEKRPRHSLALSLIRHRRWRPHTVPRS